MPATEEEVASGVYAVQSSRSQLLSTEMSIETPMEMSDEVPDIEESSDEAVDILGAQREIDPGMAEALERQHEFVSGVKTQWNGAAGSVTATIGNEHDDDDESDNEDMQDT